MNERLSILNFFGWVLISYLSNFLRTIMEKYFMSTRTIFGGEGGAEIQIQNRLIK